MLFGYRVIAPIAPRLAVALLLGTALPALAQTSISTATTTQVLTGTTNAGAPGDITVTAGGSVTVATGAAATINSNNLLTNQGSIVNSGTTGVTGVLIDGTGGLTNARFLTSGTIQINGTGGSGNTGLRIANGSIIGSIQTGIAGSISVAGDQAIGVSLAAPFTGNVALRSITVGGTGSSLVSVTAPLTGNLSLFGGSTNGGGGGYGILVTAPVSGTLRNAGVVSVGSSTSLNATGTGTVPGLIGLAGIRVSSSVGGGILNDRFFVDAAGLEVPSSATTTTVTGAVVTTGTAPALLVAPTATNPQAINIGAGAGGFGIDNQGTLRTTAGNPALAVTTVQIGGGGAATSITGGLRSGANAVISASAIDATATAIGVLAGASVPQIVNLGGIESITSQSVATGTTPQGPGGAAFGIAIGSGASVAGITNSGTITVTARGTGQNATAIRDQSGTLASITNSGTIAASALGGAAARAIDLSGSTAAFTLANSGAISGDVVLGNGATTVLLSGGSISGALAFGTGANTLVLSGTASQTGTITAGAPLAVSLAGTSRLSLVNGPASVSSLSASGASVLLLPTRGTAPALTVTGAASFTGTSSISLSLQSLSQVQTVTVVSAAGGLSTDHAGTLVNPNVTPYLFTASAPVLTPTTLSIDLVRRTAAEIGLTGGQANLFNQSLTALGNGTPEAVAIANLPNQAAVVAAYRQLTPPSYGRAATRAAETFADNGFGAAAERLASIAATRKKSSGDIGVWAQEIGNFVKDKGSPGGQQTPFSTNTLGFAIGADKPLLGFDAVGVAVLANWASVNQQVAPGIADVPVQINTQAIEPYLSWSWKSFFVQANALAAKARYSSRRTVSIGSLTNTIDARWNGTQFGAGVTVGARLKYGRFQIVPSNSLFWSTVRQGGYSETGGGAFNLGVDSRTDTILTDTVRLSLTYLRPMGEGNLLAEVHGSYSQRLQNSNAPTVAHFLTGGDSIVLPQEAESKSRYGYGGGVGYVQGAVKFILGYDRRQNSSFKDQQGAFTATMSF